MSSGPRPSTGGAPLIETTSRMAKYGLPRALYTDWKNVYVREPAAKERLHGKPGLTQFGRMCERLEIKVMAARRTFLKTVDSF